MSSDHWFLRGEDCTEPHLLCDSLACGESCRPRPVNRRGDVPSPKGVVFQHKPAKSSGFASVEMPSRSSGQTVKARWVTIGSRSAGRRRWRSSPFGHKVFSMRRINKSHEIPVGRSPTNGSFLESIFLSSSGVVASEVSLFQHRISFERPGLVAWSDRLAPGDRKQLEMLLAEMTQSRPRERERGRRHIL